MAAAPLVAPEIVLYHSAWCRSLRVRWYLEELRLPYKLVVKRYTPEELQDPQYLKVHPLGQVPALQYGSVSVWESGAIIDFLGRVLVERGMITLAPPTDLVRLARYLQFFHFAESIMTPIHAIVAHTHDLPEAKRIAQVAEQARERLDVRLRYLDEEFAKNGPFILGEAFSAADIMLGYSLAGLQGMVPKELQNTSYRHVIAYLANLQKRPAYKRAFEDEYNQE